MYENITNPQLHINSKLYITSEYEQEHIVQIPMINIEEIDIKRKYDIDENKIKELQKDIINKDSESKNKYFNNTLMMSIQYHRILAPTTISLERYLKMNREVFLYNKLLSEGFSIKDILNSIKSITNNQNNIEIQNNYIIQNQILEIFNLQELVQRSKMDPKQFEKHYQYISKTIDNVTVKNNSKKSKIYADLLYRYAHKILSYDKTVLSILAKIIGEDEIPYVILEMTKEEYTYKKEKYDKLKQMQLIDKGGNEMTKKYMIFDTETNSLPSKKIPNSGAPIQLSYIITDLDKVYQSDNIYIKQNYINPSAEEIHKISLEMLNTQLPSIQPIEAFSKISPIINDHTLVAHNFMFDKKVINVLSNQVGQPILLGDNFTNFECSLNLAKADKRILSKSKSLVNLMEYYNIQSDKIISIAEKVFPNTEIRGPHDATYDVIATLLLMRRLKNRI